METSINKLKEYLNKHSISVVQFAKNTGIPQDRVYSWMRGRGKPKAEDQKKIDALMGIGINANEQDTKTPAPLQETGDDLTAKYIALLERQESRLNAIAEATARAAVDKLAVEYVSKKELEPIRSSLETLETQAVNGFRELNALRLFFCEQIAEIKGVPVDDVDDLLDIALADDPEPQKTGTRSKAAAHK